jgi:hypothetical protein
LTITDIEIAMLTLQHDLIFSLSFMYNPWDYLKQRSPDILSHDEIPVHFTQSSDFGGQ